MTDLKLTTWLWIGSVIVGPRFVPVHWPSLELRPNLIYKLQHPPMQNIPTLHTIFQKPTVYRNQWAMRCHLRNLGSSSFTEWTSTNLARPHRLPHVFTHTHMICGYIWQATFGSIRMWQNPIAACSYNLQKLMPVPYMFTWFLGKLQYSLSWIGAMKGDDFPIKTNDFQGSVVVRSF